METERLLLRPFCAKDAADCLRNWALDLKVFRWISMDVLSKEEVEAWLATAADVYSDLETYYWAIVEKKTNEVIGEIFVDDLSNRNKRCEISWKIGSAFWNQGYTTEAAKHIISFFQNEVGIHRIQAKCCVKNIASECVMRKLGMQKEGILKDFFLGKDGNYEDVAVYSLLNRED